MDRWLRPAQPAVNGAIATFTAVQGLLILAIILINQACNVGATSCFAASGHSDRLKTFVFWQIAGGFFGLGIQLTFAGLVRYWSLTFANVVGIGLAFVSAQVFAAYMIFNESFKWPQWLGTALVFAGVLLVALHPQR